MADREMTRVEKQFFLFMFPASMALIIGFILLFGSIPNDREWHKMLKTGTPVQAQIVALDKVSVRHGRNVSHVTKPYIEFTYNDKAYEGRLDTYRQEWKPGDTIEIYVSKSNPKDFMAEPVHSSSIYIAGLAMMVAGIAAIYLGFRKFDTDMGMKPSDVFRELVNSSKI